MAGISMDFIISVQNVSFSYEENGKTILKNVSLDIKEGEFWAIVGRNGSGKSTLAKHLNTILLPKEGKVYSNSIDTADEGRVFEIRQNVGMVFQNPDNQIVATSVEEDVAFAPENLGVPSAQIRERIDRALKEVDMLDYIDYPPHFLSGGQKQRVAIAGVIAMLPKVIVMDEPTAMLDPYGRKEIMKTVKHLNRELGITVVYITHFMQEALEADYVAVMDDGEIVLKGRPVDIFKNVDLIQKAGLTLPQSLELINMLKESGARIDGDIVSFGDCCDCIAWLLGEVCK